jgi:type I restriction enzyme, R subunit
MPNLISEDQIERALVQKLRDLHRFDSLNCYTEDPEELNDRSGRSTKRDVLLLDRVKANAVRLNPNIPVNTIDDALEKLADRRQAMSLVAANQEITIFCAMASQSSSTIQEGRSNKSAYG